MKQMYSHDSNAHPEAPKQTQRYRLDYSKDFLERELEANKKGFEYPDHEAAIQTVSNPLVYLKTEIIAAKSEHKYYSHKLKHITHWNFRNAAHLESSIKDLRTVLCNLSDEINWLQETIDRLTFDIKL